MRPVSDTLLGNTAIESAPPMRSEALISRQLVDVFSGSSAEGLNR